ncbi:MAG: hypothetical protein PHD35_02045 [Synergistaceae bacterium]|jgi:hypothetical protein|nr:hypothetical protein [Synergistaceae bacterium]
MRKKHFATLLCAAALLLFPAWAGALPEQPSPDPVQAANDFITGLTGGSPAALGYASDASDLVFIGKLVLEGRHGEAMNKVGEFTAGKMIGASAPAVGQIVALGKIGKMAGDAAANWVGQKNFERIYDRMLEVAGPVDKWPKDRARAKRDEFFQAVLAAEYRYLETYLIKNGFAKNVAEAEDVAVDMILAKGRFESLCDAYGLEGKNRTLAVLEREIRIEAEVAAEIARDKELARVARLEEERKAKEKEQAEKKEEKPAEEKTAAALPAPSMPEDYPQQMDPASQKPSAPPEAPAPAAPKPAPAPLKPAPSAPEVPLRWTVTPRLMDKGSTSFAITVTNVSGKPIPGFSVSLAPLNQSLDGGVGWGSPPSPGTLAPGASVTVTAFAMGDAEGVAVSFSGNGKNLASVTAQSVHSVEKRGERHFSGNFMGGTGRGTISVTLSGGSATVVINGVYTDSSQNVRINAAGTGVFTRTAGGISPASGSLSVNWSGTAVGKMTVKGTPRDVNERVSGTLTGNLMTGTAGGSFRGRWTGGSRFVQLSGTWNAGESR